MLLGKPWKDESSIQYREKLKKYVLLFGERKHFIEPSDCLKCVDKEHLLVRLVNTNPLLSTNKDTRILPSITPYLI